MGVELSTLTPGATTSGLMRKSTSVGPWLLNPAMMSAFGVAKYASAAPMVVDAPFPALSACPSSRPTM
jgi:hypothetical protein